MNPREHTPLTIGQVAELADVSPRTVRHHHQIGLLGEAELAAGIDGDALRQDLGAEEEQAPEVKALAIQAMTSEVLPLSPAQHQALRRYLQKAVSDQTRPA